VENQCPDPLLSRENAAIPFHGIRWDCEAHLRVAAGQAVARRKGKKWGGSKPGWRWKVSDDQVIAIKEMKAAGKKVTRIARVTGLSRPTIYRVLEGTT
jgi:hypothetical protein